MERDQEESHNRYERTQRFQDEGFPQETQTQQILRTRRILEVQDVQQRRSPHDFKGGRRAALQRLQTDPSTFRRRHRQDENGKEA